MNVKEFTDEELISLDSMSFKNELYTRGYKYGWHKEETFSGSIYILVNDAFPSLVKIGYADNVEKRIKQLNSNSGLPDPYHCYAIYKVKQRLEDLKLHDLIDGLDNTLRHSKNREFYEISKEKAYNILSIIAEINGCLNLLIINPLNDDYFTKEPIVTPVLNKTKRKLPFTFDLVNISIGSILTYKEDTSKICTVADNKNHVIYNDMEYTLSGLVLKFKGGTSWRGPAFFTYNGKLLTDIRKEMEFDE